MIEIKDKDNYGIKDLGTKGFILLDDDFKIEVGKVVKDGDKSND